MIKLGYLMLIDNNASLGSKLFASLTQELLQLHTHIHTMTRVDICLLFGQVKVVL